MIAPYLIGISILTILELFRILPIVNNQNFEVGSVNLLLILTLQIITFTIWTFILKFYSWIDDVNLLGLEHLDTKTSRNFLISALTKGLYISILFHFFNNFLHNLSWNVVNEQKKLEILQLFADSTRIDNHRTISLKNLSKLLELPMSQTVNNSLTMPQAQTLFLFLYNIQHNYVKNNSSYSVQISINQNILTITFTSPTVTKQKQNTWDRNLGTMKQFLQLTNQGTVSIKHSKNFSTTLTFNCN
ncbi:hypothetical protein IT418_01620 [bacterium]|nr:hypothetical protein [bacterium]